MKLNDYKYDLDTIKSTPEFRKRMVGLLTAEPSAEYADSVSEVEPARRINISRYAAVAASAVLALGVGGAAVMNLRHGADPTEESVSSETKDPNVPAADNEGSDISVECTVYGRIDGPDDTYYMDECNLGKLPDTVVYDTIVPVLRDGFSNDMIMIFDSEPESTAIGEIVMEFDGTGDRFDLDFIEDMPFTYTVDSNGLNCITQNDNKTYFSIDCYDSIMLSIACSTPELDWASFHGTPEISMIFEKYAGQFRLRDVSDEYSDDYITSALLIVNDIFSVELSDDDDIRASFITSEGERRCAFFETPAGFSNKVWSIIFDGSTDIDLDGVNGSGDELADRIDDVLNNADEGVALVYLANSGEGGSPCYIKYLIDCDPVIDAVKNISWTAFTAQENNLAEFYADMNVDVFRIGSFIISRDGVILDTEDMKKYTPVGDGSAVVNAIYDIINNDDAAKADFLLASSFCNYNTMKAKMSIMTDFDLNDPLVNASERINHVVSGDGMLYYNNEIGSEFSEYITLSDPDRDHDIVYIESNTNWLYDEYGDALKDMYPKANLTIEDDNRYRFRSADTKGWNLMPTIRRNYIQNYAMYILNNALMAQDDADNAAEQGITLNKLTIDNKLASDGYINVSVSIVNGANHIKLDMNIDDRGTITECNLAEKSEDSADNRAFLMNLNNIEYDSPDFAIPELTAEQARAFN